MNILVTGSGSRAGSWPIRGEQLGAAIGATVLPRAADATQFDVAVLVKRVLPAAVAAVKRAGVPLVYDIVDAWPQPEGNDWPRETCLAWLRAHIGAVRPDGIVAATQAMARDCAEFGVPVLALPHHARPGLVANPLRDAVKLVGYEGAERHLGAWRPWLEKECARRGWSFVVNPERLADVDIVVALRERTGYAPMTWKSGVKLSNAQGSGTPIVCAREAGYLEQACGVERFVSTEADVARAFDQLAPLRERTRCAGWMRAVAPRLEDVAATYLNWLAGLCSTAARS